MSKEELQEAQDGWRAVLRLLFSHILKQAKEVSIRLLCCLKH